MLHDSLSKPSFTASRRVDEAVVGRGEKRDGQLQRVDIPAHVRTARNGFQQKRLEEDLGWAVPHVIPRIQSVEELNWTDMHGDV